MDHIGIEGNESGRWDSYEGNRSNREAIVDRDRSTIAGAIDLERMSQTLAASRSNFEGWTQEMYQTPERTERARRFLAFGQSSLENT
jgi:hypothetical protein